MARRANDIEERRHRLASALVERHPEARWCSSSVGPSPRTSSRSLRRGEAWHSEVGLADPTQTERRNSDA